MIGERFPDSIAIKKTIGSQTPTMKAIKHIISKDSIVQLIHILIGSGLLFVETLQPFASLKDLSTHRVSSPLLRH